MGETMACDDCGMTCEPNEFHPYAACLMFKACHNSKTVRANLDFVREYERDMLRTTPAPGGSDG